MMRMTAIPDYCLKIRSMVDLGATVKDSTVDMLPSVLGNQLTRGLIYKVSDVSEKQYPMVAAGTLLHE